MAGDGELSSGLSILCLLKADLVTCSEAPWQSLNAENRDFVKTHVTTTLIDPPTSAGDMTQHPKLR